MKKVNANYGKYIAIFVVFIMVVSIFIGAADGFRKGPEPQNAVNASGDESSIANDIANMTGVSTETIAKLRAEGKTWEQVLEYIKSNQDTLKNSSDNTNEQMVENELGKDAVEQLKEQGFKESEIVEAKMLVERIAFQLEEITTEDNKLPEVPSVDINKPLNDKKDIEAYKELLSKFDIKAAVIFALKLKDSFGSMEKVLDEYLLSLQIGTNLENYLKDKTAYEKERNQKSMEFGVDKIITLQKIEEKMLEKLQQSNKDKEKEDNTSLIPNQQSVTASFDPKNDMPEPPLPEVENTAVESPADQVMKEINSINNNGINQTVNGMGR